MMNRISVVPIFFITILTVLLLINNSQTVKQSTILTNQRVKKFFPLFSVIRFANSECYGSNSLNGTCFTRRECYSYKGLASGSCANGHGVCCTFKRECGTTTHVNNTYFVNPGYYATYAGGERCLITVYPCNSDICQLKIDFLEFSLAQPNATGVCDYDFLLVSGGASNVPRICGENSNNHMYVDFNGDNPITISVDTNTDYSFARKWNLRLRQIACDSVQRAPNGCLQYFKTSSGTVMSFNYGTIPNPRVFMPYIVPGTRQILNLNYGICVKMTPGYCTIEWSQADSSSFTISDDPGSAEENPSDTIYPISGEECDHNFVIVPNPSYTNGTRYNTDRFCGNEFETKVSSSKPFVLYVVTNLDQFSSATPNSTDVITSADTANRGFILKYRQLPCLI